MIPLQYSEILGGSGGLMTGSMFVTSAANSSSTISAVNLNADYINLVKKTLNLKFTCYDNVGYDVNDKLINDTTKTEIDTLRDLKNKLKTYSPANIAADIENLTQQLSPIKLEIKKQEDFIKHYDECSNEFDMLSSSKFSTVIKSLIPTEPTEPKNSSGTVTVADLDTVTDLNAITDSDTKFRNNMTNKLNNLYSLYNILNGSIRSKQEILVHLFEANASLSDGKFGCVICTVSSINYIFKCGHSACADCKSKIKTCHMCRGSLDGAIKMIDN